MERRRLLQTILLTLATLFLLVLALKFKPRIETPAPVPLPKPKDSVEGTLSAQSFRYAQQTGEKTDFVVTADEVTETPQGEKVLTRPVVVIPLAEGREDRATGARGTLDPATKTLRIFEGGKIESGGWTCESSGFRFTPEGEAVSEGPVTFSREEMRGSAELLTYHRARRRAVLEGSVHLAGTEGKSMRCSKLLIDLENHKGSLEGPLAFASEEGTLTAPRGTLALTPENRLRSVELSGPVRGEGPKGTLDARSLLMDADASGKPSRYTFRGAVHLATTPPEPSHIRTELLALQASTGREWTWSAPVPLTLEGRGEMAHAPSGTGKFGEKGGPAADLAGPVLGTGEQGDFSGNRAALREGTWSLKGEASLCRGGDTLRATTITWKPDGAGRAEGSVTGTRTPPGRRDPLSFSGDRAEMAAGGYPIRISGDATLTSGAMALAAPRVELLSADRATASGGVLGTLQDAGSGESRMRAESAGYDGAKDLAWAQGAATAEGRGYFLEGTRIEAHLDASRRAERYEALGAARFTGAAYDGEGDRLVYTPSTNSGEAHREGRDAVVIQKSPYRRLTAPVVRFAPSRVETPATGEAVRRGRLEGQAPRAAQSGPKPAKPTGAKGVRTGGAHG